MSALWSDPVFGPITRELYRRCGLVFEGGQAQLFRRRVERRAKELGYAEVASYLGDLRGRLGEAEYDRLIERLTVNETYFFREEEHFQFILGQLWPAWTAHGDNPIRIWSAACSTGCEPYTLGILLRERGIVGPGRPRVEILATDVNERVIREAKEGRYGEFSLRATPPHFRQKYFRREGHAYRLVPSVVEMVTFRKYNLLDPGTLFRGEGFQVVLCRNVLIYFDQEAKRRAVRVLTRALRSGGTLVVGRSESLFNVPEAPPLVNAGGVLVYRKP